jgi:hypothetical protein
MKIEVGRRRLPPRHANINGEEKGTERKSQHRRYKNSFLFDLDSPCTQTAGETAAAYCMTITHGRGRHVSGRARSAGPWSETTAGRIDMVGTLPTHRGIEGAPRLYVIFSPRHL